MIYLPDGRKMRQTAGFVPQWVRVDGGSAPTDAIASKSIDPKEDEPEEPDNRFLNKLHRPHRAVL